MGDQVFKVGDLVRLKSGSPSMVVWEVDHNGMAGCEVGWYSFDDGRVRRSFVSMACLVADPLEKPAKVTSSAKSYLDGAIGGLTPPKDIPVPPGLLEACLDMVEGRFTSSGRDLRGRLRDLLDLPK